MTAQPTAAQMAQMNAQIRANILANGIPIIQNVRSGSATYTAGQPTIINMLASNVGLIRRFYLEITGTVNCATSHTLTPTPIGMPNILSNVQYIDQNNRLRINTTGAHLHFAACEMRKRLFGSADLASSITDPSGFGGNFLAQKTTGTVTGGTAKTFTWIYEIPVVVSNKDLTGAVYANQTTSNNQIQLTLNPNIFAGTGTDGFYSAYKCDAAVGTTLPTLTNISWTLYQDFIDQIPQGSDGFAQLPPLDIAYARVFTTINPGVQVASQDNLYALPPFNVYANLMLFWDNYTYNTSVGGDVNYIKVQVSNTYVLKQYDPQMLGVINRNLIGTDFPAFISAAESGAVYNLDFRDKPLSVNQLSSTNIVFNPSTVASATSNLQIAQEYLWFANQQAA